MKILHLSDLHIDKIVFEQSMLDDQEYMLKQIIEKIEKEKIEIEKDKEELENLKNNLSEQKQKQINLNSKYISNKETLNTLSSDSTELLKLTELYVALDELYKTASGTLAGKRKIEFEQYVQAAYFDMILIEANKKIS